MVMTGEKYAERQGKKTKPVSPTQKTTTHKIALPCEPTSESKTGEKLAKKWQTTRRAFPSSLVPCNDRLTSCNDMEDYTIDQQVWTVSEMTKHI